MAKPKVEEKKIEVKPVVIKEIKPEGNNVIHNHGIIKEDK